MNELKDIEDLYCHLLDEMEVFCVNKRHGCKATMKRIELEQHVNEYCEYHVCGNDGCEDGKKGKRKEMKQHMDVECGWSVVGCDGVGCEWRGRRNEKEKHWKMECEIRKKEERERKEREQKEREERERKKKEEERRKKLEKERETLRRVNPNRKEEIVRLTVGERCYVTTRDTLLLRAPPTSRLALLFGGEFEVAVGCERDGHVFLDRFVLFIYY